MNGKKVNGKRGKEKEKTRDNKKKREKSKENNVIFHLKYHHQIRSVYYYACDTYTWYTLCCQMQCVTRIHYVVCVLVRARVCERPRVRCVYVRVCVPTVYYIKIINGFVLCVSIFKRTVYIYLYMCVYVDDVRGENPNLRHVCWGGEDGDVEYGRVHDPLR